MYMHQFVGGNSVLKASQVNGRVNKSTLECIPHYTEHCL